MIASPSSMTDGRDPYGGWDNYDPITTITGGTIWIRCSPAETASTAIFVSAQDPVTERGAALGYKRWVSWCNMLDRMDEQRHARGAELLRLPDTKVLFPRRKAPSVGRVCSGSSRYRVMSPCG